MINVAALSFLVADAVPYSAAITTSILRGFGAHRLMEARSTRDAIDILLEHTIDIMLCDIKLPNGGGVAFAKSIRGNADIPCRTIPILLTSGDTRVSLVKQSRDAGVNMVVAKPMSPAALYDRLVWVAFNPKRFIDSPDYFGPDRRFKIEGLPDGVGRRSEDNTVEIGEDAGPAMSQSEIDNLLQKARSGDADE